MAPGDAAESADDGRAERLEPEHRPHLLGDEEDGPDQDAGRRPEDRAVGEGDGDHRRDPDAEQPRHLLVLRRRLHLLAQRGLLEEEVLETEQGQGAQDDDDVLGVDKHSEDVQRVAEVGRGMENGSAPKTICAPFFRKMETPMVLMTTGRKVRLRSG